MMTADQLLCRTQRRLQAPRGPSIVAPPVVLWTRGPAGGPVAPPVVLWTRGHAGGTVDPWPRWWYCGPVDPWPRRWTRRVLTDRLTYLAPPDGFGMFIVSVHAACLP